MQCTPSSLEATGNSPSGESWKKSEVSTIKQK